MRKTSFCVLAFLCTITSVTAQSNNPSILSPAGGSDKTSTISLDWTMGEYAVETVSLADRMYTQGFHQPYLVVISPLAFTLNKSVYNIAIAPNPVLSTLNFSINSSKNTQVLVSLADIHGRLLLHRKVNSSFGNIQLDFKALPPGSYNLSVREAGSSRVIKSYQVIKL